MENIYNSYGELTERRTFRGGTWTGSTWPGGTADATTYTYDGPSGLLTRAQDAAANHTDYTYNDRGLVATREWARLNASSQRVKTTYSYASNSTELTGKSYNDNTPDVSFTYNRIGRMLTAVDVSNGSTTQTRTFEYNAYQQLAVEKLPSYLGSRWLTYTYETGTGGTLEGRGSGYELGVSSDPDQDMKSLLGYSGTTGLVTSLTATHAGVAARAFAYSYASNTSLLTGITQSTIGYTQTRAYETDRDLLKEITTKFSTTTKSRFDYTFNSLGQKVSAKQSGQSGSAFADYGNDTFYRYQYNSRGELTLAAGYLGAEVNTYNSSNALSGRYFELGYDQAGNRASHNASGVAGLAADYTVNALNQITGRENHYVPVSGTVDSAAKVVVNGELAGQQGNYWSGEAVLDNSSGPAYASTISVKAAKTSPETKQISGLLSAFIAPAAETLGYDADGNLTSDGRWTYAYDAENHLVQMETNSTAMAVGLPGKRYIFRYDSLGRRTAKESWSWSGSAWSLTQDLRFVYQGWNLVAELKWNSSTSTLDLNRTHAWGLDIAGTMGGTGGIGALVQTVDHTGTATAYLPGYDGAGNVTALMQSDGTIAAKYDGARQGVDGQCQRHCPKGRAERGGPLGREARQYSPFGRALRSEGAYADENPFRFSTKYTDETGLVYYGHRYYSPDLGRFINRDPIGEQGGVNLYAFVRNNAVNAWDYLGLSGGVPDPEGRTDANGNLLWIDGDDIGQLLNDAAIWAANKVAEKIGVAPMGGTWAESQAWYDAQAERQAAYQALQSVLKRVKDGETVKVVGDDGKVHVLDANTNFSIKDQGDTIASNVVLVTENGGGPQLPRVQARITGAEIAVNRFGFRDFDKKAKATVDFVGALEDSAISFNMLPSAKAPENVVEAIMYWSDVINNSPNRQNSMSEESYKNIVSRAITSIGEKVGGIGPFEARTIITYQQMETRPLFIFWTQEVWISRTVEQEVNGPLPGGLFTSRGAALDAAAKVLVDRINLLPGIGGLPN